MRDERAMRQGRGEVKRGNYTDMEVDPKTGAYVPLPPVNIQDEGFAGAGKKIYDLGKRAASGINKMIGHGSDEELLKQLGKDAGVVHPTGSKRPTPPGQSSGDTPRDIFLKGETGSERAVRLGDPRVKNTTGKRPPRDPDGEDNEIIRPDDPRAIRANAYFDKQVKEAGKKLNFADKIANAKKEVDEMLGDVAAEAMRSALSPKQKKMAALGGDPKRIDGPDLAALRKGAKMGEERSKGTAFDMSTKRVDTPKPGSTERGAKHDIKHSTSDPRYTGRTVTRRTDAQGISVGADDDSDTQAGPRGRGRPKGTKGAIGAKGPSGKSKLMTKEGEVDIRDQGEYDQEGDMAKDDIKTIVRHAQALSRVLGDDDNLPEWVQSKLAKIEGMMISIDEYMQNQAGDEEEPIAEEPKSKNQAVAARIARGVQKGTAKAKPGSASAEMAKMKPGELNKFAKGSTKGLPKKVSKNKEEVDENSDQGRITTTRTGPGKTLTTSSTGRVSATIGNGKMSVKPGKQDKPMDDDTDTASSSTKNTSKPNSMVGKGIYDSMNRELELMIAESMSINMSDSTEGNKSLTVTATDDDAMKLAMLLKNAGLGGGDMHSHGEQPCATCGMPDCGCGDVQEAVDENAPDYPTNTEQADNNFGYAGGLNKPKADIAGNGQSTVPVVATRPHNNDDLRRMMEMAGLAEAAKPDFLDINKNGDKEESMKDAAADVNEEEDTVEESIQRMREAAGIKIKNDLGPTSPEVARMSKDEVNAALRSGMSPKVDLGPTSPDIARMSNDEVNAALKSGMSPDISNMDSDSVNAEFGKDSSQYEDSIQRMREMAGIQEFSVKLDSPPRTGSYPDQLYGKDKERYDAVQTGSGPESQRVNQYYQNKPTGSYDPMTKHADQGAADYADRLNAVRAARIANNELTPGEWMQKGTNAVRKAFGGEDRPLKPARTVVDLDGPDQSPAHRYVGSDKPQWPSTQRYLDPKADAQYKARQKALFPDEFKEEKTEEGNLFTKGLEDNDVKIGDRIPGTDAIKTTDIGESIFALTNQWKAYKG
jgi:hypothetical protein